MQQIAMQLIKAANPMGISRRIRAMVRARESSLILLAILVGLLGGLVVLGMGQSVGLMHLWLFGVPLHERLSGQLRLEPLLAVSVPFLGGLVFGLGSEVIKRWRPSGEVDPIEANALHGGRMSLLGSFIVAAQTVWSSGVGASVGLEAGYTQLASGIASRIGIAFRLRRNDLRILVGCGAAAAIAGAFGAPLAGAFYAFELIIGSYAPSGLAPIGIAALMGYLVARSGEAESLSVIVPDRATLVTSDLVLAALIGLLSAMTGIVVMRGVALCETIYTRLKVRPLLRTGAGGLAVGLLALISPQVMSSGHGALRIIGMLDLSLDTVALILALKLLASIASLGSGFRGGLFFASLLMGALGGHLVSVFLLMAWPTMTFDTNAAALIGMSALSASVIGAPLTMTFIALETTGDLWLTAAVLIAVIIAAQITRESFGYSFATWRFHLRGETIRSAADVGWMRDLTVERMMRQDVQTVHANMDIAAFREAFPLGATANVVALDNFDQYVGIVVVSEAYATDTELDKSVETILHFRQDTLLPTMAVKEAVLAFDRAEAEALAVVDSVKSRRVIGILTEAYVLRRYSAALENRRRDLAGE